MVVYPDLAFLMGLTLHGGNLYLFLKFHALHRPRWQRFLFLFCSSLHSALFVMPGIPSLLIFFLALVSSLLFLRGKTLRGTIRNVTFYFIVEGTRLALTVLFCGIFFSLSLVFLQEGGYFLSSFFSGLFGAFFSFCALLLLFRYRSHKIGEKRIFTCAVVLDGKRATFRCYGDSGNFLTDPLGGSPVAILELSALRRAFGSSFPLPLSYEFATRFEGRMRVIPLRGVSGTGEMLSAFVPDGFFVEGEPRNATIAVTPRCLDGCGRFCGIIGPSLSEGV